MARLAAFDMDGTLLMPNHHLGDETLSTLARLREPRHHPDVCHWPPCAGDASYLRDPLAGRIFDNG